VGDHVGIPGVVLFLPFSKSPFPFLKLYRAGIKPKGFPEGFDPILVLLCENMLGGPRWNHVVLILPFSKSPFPFLKLYHTGIKPKGFPEGFDPILVFLVLLCENMLWSSSSSSSSREEDPGEEGG
jgi:hypothetical protein